MFVICAILMCVNQPAVDGIDEVLDKAIAARGELAPAERELEKANKLVLRTSGTGVFANKINFK